MTVARFPFVAFAPAVAFARLNALSPPAAFILLAALSCAPLTASAQHAGHQSPRPASAVTPVVTTPLPPSASTTRPAPQLRSGFERYQRFDADTPLTDWREANQMVQQIGGWRAYAREAAAAATSQTPPVKPIPPTNTGAPK